MITHEVSGKIINETSTYETLDVITSSLLDLTLIDFLGQAKRVVGIYGIAFSLGGVSICFSKDGVNFSYTEVFK